MSAVEMTTDVSHAADAQPAEPRAVKRPRPSVLQWLLARQVPWYRQLWNLLNGDGGAGAALSFVVHVILLALFAIPVYQHVHNGSVITTTVENAAPDPTLITTEIDPETLLALPKGAGGGADADTMLTTSLGPAVSNLPSLTDAVAAKGEDGDLGAEGALGGLRVAEPTNAVKAGSFTVFILPVAFAGESVEAGQAPRPGQDYYIVVQMAMPKARTIYPLRDLSGDIEGTDGYKQKIPEKAFAMGPENQLIPVNPRRGLKVVDDVVQVFIRVPGGGRKVRDTINVRSALLKEQQELVLTFE